MSMLFVGSERKDNKINVTYGFDNGSRFNKILTRDKLKEAICSGKYDLRGNESLIRELSI